MYQTSTLAVIVPSLLIASLGHLHAADAQNPLPSMEIPTLSTVTELSTDVLKKEYAVDARKIHDLAYKRPESPELKPALWSPENRNQLKAEDIKAIYVQPLGDHPGFSPYHAEKLPALSRVYVLTHDNRIFYTAPYGGAYKAEDDMLVVEGSAEKKKDATPADAENPTETAETTEKTAEATTENPAEKNPEQKTEEKPAVAGATKDVTNDGTVNLRDIVYERINWASYKDQVDQLTNLVHIDHDLFTLHTSTDQAEIAENGIVSTQPLDPEAMVSSGYNFEVALNDTELTRSWTVKPNYMVALDPLDFTGIAGEHGFDGDHGQAGADGQNGDPGIDGRSGQPGRHGRSGSSAGYRGDDGGNGARGENGRQGANGVNGEHGAAGIAGENGLDGENAPPVEMLISPVDCQWYEKPLKRIEVKQPDLNRHQIVVLAWDQNIAVNARGGAGGKGGNGGNGGNGGKGGDGGRGGHGGDGGRGGNGGNGAAGQRGRNATQYSPGTDGGRGGDGGKGGDGGFGGDGSRGGVGGNGGNGGPGANGANGGNGANGATVTVKVIGSQELFDAAKKTVAVDVRGGDAGVLGSKGKGGIAGKGGKAGAAGKAGRAGAAGGPGSAGAGGKGGNDRKAAVAASFFGALLNGGSGSDGLADGLSKYQPGGRDGSPGRAGTSGQAGRNGRDGQVGRNGRDGRNGPDGKDGLPGKPGADGKQTWTLLAPGSEKPAPAAEKPAEPAVEKPAAEKAEAEQAAEVTPEAATDAADDNTTANENNTDAETTTPAGQ